MKLEILSLARSEQTALESRSVIPFVLCLSIVAGCGDGASADASAGGGRTIENVGGVGGAQGEPLQDDRLVGMGAARGSEDVAEGGSANEAGASGEDASDPVASTDCAALPRRAARYGGSMETTAGTNCGVWALSIVPEGAGNAYVLTRAERDAASPLRTFDTAVVLTGPVIASMCTNEVVGRHAVFAGAGLGPAPFLQTSLTVEYFQSTGESIVNAVIDTHLAVGAVECEGPLSLEFR